MALKRLCHEQCADDYLQSQSQLQSEVTGIQCQDGAVLIRQANLCYRPLETNLTRLVAEERADLTNFWSITYHLNRLYASLHGYRFHRPRVDDEQLREMLSDGLYPPRRVQWAIVRLVQQELEDRTCEYVVWMDSDAYVASSEPLETVLEEYGLLNKTGCR
eukprot:s159_g23.t5